MYPFACKVMQRAFLDMRGIGAQIAFEINAMQTATAQRIENVVHMIDTAEEAGCVFMLLELCPCGNLQQTIFPLEVQGQRLVEEQIATWARHLLQGLRDLHALNIMHRDIKTENLLITQKGTLKITDFGWCADTSSAPTALAGTFSTMAPEVLRNEPQTKAVDVWAAGAVIMNLVLGRALLKTDINPGATQLTHSDLQAATQMRQERLLEEIGQCCPPPLHSRPEGVSNACWDFLRCLLVPDVIQRMTAAEALEHEWLRTPAPCEGSEAPPCRSLKDLVNECRKAAMETQELAKRFAAEYRTAPALEACNFSPQLDAEYLFGQRDSVESRSTSSPSKAPKVLAETPSTLTPQSVCRSTPTSSMPSSPRGQ
jgi:serine/threonine protein kinase